MTGTTPPDRPTASQQSVVDRGRLVWHSQTPLCALGAYLLTTRTNIRRRFNLPESNRSILRLTAISALPIVVWDFWYYAKAERVVKERQAWERAQRSLQARNWSAGPRGSSGAGGGQGPSEATMSDPWA